MKFNEKLIKLRKNEGLSQEELGYKLNVTRQTISKWELGQTTPEMDKLTEISNFFGVSVDTLLNETESEFIKEDVKIEDSKIGSGNNSGLKIVLIILGVILGLSIICILVYSILFKGILNFGEKNIEKGTKLIENVMSKGLDLQEKNAQENREKFNQIQKDMEEEYEQKTQQNQDEFNQVVEQMNDEYENNTQQMMENVNQWQQQMMQQQELFQQTMQ